MSTLTIKDLAPYLPYGLKGKIILTEYEVEYSDSPLDSMDYLNSEIQVDGIEICLDDENETTVFKPMLRPLSQLTETILHEGKEIVPILEVAKRCGHPNLKLYEFDGRMGCGFNQKVSDDDVQGYEFAFDEKVKAFCIYYDEKDTGSPLTIESGYDEMEYLFSLHFDVFGLIERGLAIPIPSLKTTEV